MERVEGKDLNVVIQSYAWGADRFRRRRPVTRFVRHVNGMH